MANGHGGRRPGAGAKKKSTEEQQVANREIIIANVTSNDIKDITLAAVAGAKAGNPADRQWVSSYVLGNPAQQIDMTVKGVIKLVDQEMAEAL